MYVYHRCSALVAVILQLNSTRVARPSGCHVLIPSSLLDTTLELANGEAPDKTAASATRDRLDCCFPCLHDHDDSKQRSRHDINGVLRVCFLVFRLLVVDL